MNDADVIAYLFPPDGPGRASAMEAIDMHANRCRYLPPRRPDDANEPAAETQSQSSRAATEEPEDINDFECLPCLVFRFSDPPNSPLGQVVGWGRRAHMVMPQLKGVSKYHFAMTFDQQKCLLVKDLNSLVGTRVIYDGEEGQRGHGVAWSARGPRLVKDKVPIIKLTTKLQFRLVVPNHDITSQTYLDNVARFLEGQASVEDLFLDFKINSRTQTELPTPGEALTPSVQRPGRIYWKKELGRGGFAVVNYIWDVTSREEYALKEPLPNAGGDWEREAEIMKGISHDNIVTLKHASFDDGPQLYFEYVPGGSLDGYRSTTVAQRAQVAVQLLDGLTYLHEEKCVAHRDIKPANVLVQSWSPDRVHVKLADFGLSRQAGELKTFCGTAYYLAPEVFCTRLARRRKADETYGQLVDTWSLGVLLFALESGELPKYLSHYEYSGAAWGKVMVEFARNYHLRHANNALRSFVLEHMLVIEPEKRLPAKECHEKALRLFRVEMSEESGEESGEESNPSTPVALPADVLSSPDNAGASEAATVRPSVSDDETTCQTAEVSEASRPALGSMSLIQCLGERGSSFVDDLLKMSPSDQADFRRSDAPTPSTVQHDRSLADNELWDGGAVASTKLRGSDPDLVEGGRPETGSNSAGPDLRAAVMATLSEAAGDKDDPGATAVRSPPQRKRPRSVQPPSKLTDQEPGDGEHKRNRV